MEVREQKEEVEEDMKKKSRDYARGGRVIVRAKQNKEVITHGLGVKEKRRGW